MGKILGVFGAHDQKTMEQLRGVAENAAAVSIMADGHLGYVMPVGGVAAYRGLASVVGVGFDIACGNCAIKTDMRLDDLGRSDEKRSFMLNRIADEIARTISFGIGRKNEANDAPVDHPLFSSDTWMRLRERVGHGNMRQFFDKARNQLGTIGSGNHYVDVFVDENGWLWVGVHFGSRGFGHGIASGFLALGQGKEWGERVPETEVLLNLQSSLGQDYWALMELCGEYAYAGREWVTRKVVSILGAKEVDLVHNHHNFAWKETHTIDPDMGPEELVVVRKGATPAFPGQRGFVGGSMGDNAVILEGRRIDYESAVYMVDSWDAQVSALFSTVHGAGRVMGRAEAKKGRVIYDDRGIPTGKRDESSKITREAQEEWIRNFGVIVRGGDVDEAPQAYRRLPDVLAAQGETVTVLNTLKPLIVCMAGANEYDPYKD